MNFCLSNERFFACPKHTRSFVLIPYLGVYLDWISTWVSIRRFIHGGRCHKKRETLEGRLVWERAGLSSRWRVTTKIVHGWWRCRGVGACPSQSNTRASTATTPSLLPPPPPTLTVITHTHHSQSIVLIWASVKPVFCISVCIYITHLYISYFLWYFLTSSKNSDKVSSDL